MGRTLILLGVLLIILGLLWPWLAKLNLFRLPGDIVIEREGLRIYLPITSMILISAVASLVLWIVRRWF